MRKYWKRMLAMVLAVAMTFTLLPETAMAAGTGTSADPIVVYRNPVEDYAGSSLKAESVDELIDVITSFYVRESTSEAWKEQIIEAKGLTGTATDVYFNVETADLGYASISEKTSIAGIVPLNCGYWFGWGAAKNPSVASSNTETDVKVVKVTKSLFSKKVEDLVTNLTVKVKGYVDVTWDVTNDSTYNSKVILNNTLMSASEYTTATDAAKKYAKEETAKTNGGITWEFKGWDGNGDGVADTNLGSVVDVTTDGGCIAADTVDGVTYKAVYEKTYAEYEITWVDEYGTSLGKDKVKYGETPSHENPTKDADAQYTYTFSGWTPEIEPATKDATYTAHYTETLNTYTVTWVNNDGSPLDTDTVEYGETPKYEGESFEYENAEEGTTYTFTGWNPAISPVTGDITYTAQYTSAETVCTVSFNTDGGTAVEDIKVAQGETITSLPETTREGYRFDGWLLEGEAFSEDTPIESDITLTAKWIQQVTVTFDSNGGTPVVAQTIDSGAQVTQPDAPSKDNSQFNGWKLNGTSFDFETPVNEDITLVADWLDLYTVTFYANEGTGSMDSQTYVEGKAQNLNASAFTRTGYTFKGWATTSTATTVEYVDKEEITLTSNLALYAVWEEEPWIDTSVIVNNPSVSLVYNSFTIDDLITAIGPVVKDASGNEVSNATVTVTDVTTNNVGTYTVTLSYAGNSELKYKGSSATATVTITQAPANVVVSSVTVKYGTAVEKSEIFKSECPTIDFVAGIDVHDETYLTGLVQVAAPEEVLLLVGLTAQTLGIEDLTDLSIDELQKILATAYKIGTGDEQLDKALAYLAEYKESIEQLIDTLKTIQAELPVETELKISISNEIELPENIGVYLTGSILADSKNYVAVAEDGTEATMDAGYLIITPNGLKANLSWNETDDNDVLTLEKNDKFDFGANLKLDESTADGEQISKDEAEKHLEYLFIGVDNDKLVLDRRTDANESELGVGVYAEIAYVANWDNAMYYAEPIVRPIIVTPSPVKVAIIDGNGNENYAQVYTYGEEIKLAVTVDGVKAPVDGLTVKYIGSDTTVDGWYREEMPTDAGVYTVVATYSKDGKAGAATGVLIIEPADTEVGLEDAKYCYDGKEHFATITNENLDYITIAMDRKNDIAYVNLPDDTEAHVERIVSQLPSEVEKEVRDFLSKYENFDGDVQTSTLKAEMTEIIEKMIAADMTAKAEEVAKELVDAVAEEIANGEKIKELITQFESELEAIKEQVGNEIPDEIEDALTEYIKDIVTVKDGNVEVDTDKAKADIKEKIKELEGKLPQSVVDELYEMADELAEVVGSNVDINEIESNVSEIVSKIEGIDEDTVKEVIKAAIGATVGAVDQAELTALIEEAIAKVEARGYVEYIQNMIENIAGIYDGEIDTTEVEASIETLLTKIEEGLKNAYENGEINKDALTDVEKYVDEVLKSLITVIDQIPDGKVVFGHNPKEIGEYDCYAINISSNYKAEFAQAKLVIYACNKPGEGSSGEGKAEADDSDKELEGVYHPETPSTSNTTDANTNGVSTNGASTGDSANILGYAALIITAGAALVFLFLKKKKS